MTGNKGEQTNTSLAITAIFLSLFVLNPSDQSNFAAPISLRLSIKDSSKGCFKINNTLTTLR